MSERPDNWPPPERIAVIMEAIRRRIDEFRVELEERDRARERTANERT